MSQVTASSDHPPQSRWVVAGVIACTITLLVVGSLLASVAYGLAGQPDHGAQAPVAAAATPCTGESAASKLSTGPLLQNAD